MDKKQPKIKAEVKQPEIKMETKEQKINKDMTLGEVIELDERLVAVLLGFGMHCFSCAISQMETLEEAAEVHGIELDMLLEQLNEMHELNED